MNGLTTLRHISDAIHSVRPDWTTGLEFIVRGQKLLDHNKSLHALKLHNVKDMSVIRVTVPCPRCRRQSCTHEDAFQRHMKRSRHGHPLAAFDDPGIGIKATTTELSQSVFNLFGHILFPAVSDRAWQPSSQEAVRNTIFRTSESKEFQEFHAMVEKALKEKKLELGFWSSQSRKHSYLAVACVQCQYVMHTHWTAKANATLLRSLWWAWMVAEPQDLLGEDNTMISESEDVVWQIPSSEALGCEDTPALITIVPDA